MIFPALCFSHFVEVHDVVVDLAIQVNNLIEHELLIDLISLLLFSGVTFDWSVAGRGHIDI